MQTMKIGKEVDENSSEKRALRHDTHVAHCTGRMMDEKLVSP